MIQKDYLYFKTLAAMLRYKLSAGPKNNSYRLGSFVAPVVEGEPDIMWQSVVYISQTQQIWTHGKFFGPQAEVHAIYISETEWNTLTNGDTDYSQLDPNSEYNIYEEPESGGGDSGGTGGGSVSGDVLTIEGSVSGDTLTVEGSVSGDTLTIATSSSGGSSGGSSSSSVSGETITLNGTVTDDTLVLTGTLSGDTLIIG